MDEGSLADAHDGAHAGRGCNAAACEPEQTLATTLARDAVQDAVALDAAANQFVRLPYATTVPISEDNPRTVCLWARIDAWADNARLFEYGKGPAQRFGLRTYKTPGRFSVISHDPKRPSTNVTVDLNASRRVAPRPTPRPTIRGRRLDGTDSDSDNAAGGATPPNPWVATWPVSYTHLTLPTKA